MDENLIAELAQMQKRFSAIYHDFDIGFISIEPHGVHVQEYALEKIAPISEWKTTEHDSVYKFNSSVTVHGVKFYAIHNGYKDVTANN